jgi:catechol 2,3-dioxygenase-like lactoylglutathione lyase family enzyme
MQLAIEHIGLAARDTRCLSDWYQRILGAEEIASSDGQPPAFFLRLRGGLLLEIYPAEASSDQTGRNGLAGWRHLALRVDSIEKVRDQLHEAGVDLDAAIKPAGGGGRVLFLRDPEGNLMHLVERPAGSIFTA